MIVGIGTDIVRIDRIQQSLNRLGESFAKRILTDAEFTQWRSHPAQAAFLAKRFAAKEALAKALGTGIGKVAFKHIEVANIDSGAPFLTLYEHAAELQWQKKITSLHLSISDEQEYAVAFVVLESIG
ncbi:MAG: holo-ACP synthase [Endozoicomonas sp.]